MNDNAYAIHEANQAADAAAEARAEGQAQRADADYLGAPDRSPRLQLLEARYTRAIDEAHDLHEQMDAWLWYVAHVDDRAELWMRALESALAECRTALKYVRETTARRA